MDIYQILCTLRDITYFLDVFPSDLFPSSRPVLKPYTVIFNAVPPTEGGSHLLDMRLKPLFECLLF